MITRWNPWRDMVSMQNTIDQMFDESWRPLFENRISALALDIEEADDKYTVTAALPGMNPDDIRVDIHDNVLTIEGETHSETEEKDEEGKRVIMRERHYGKFSRSVRLANPVDVEAVEATYENGVLTLDIPKTEALKPHRIPVLPR